jgi:hypothetical protein
MSFLIFNTLQEHEIWQNNVSILKGYPANGTTRYSIAQITVDGKYAAQLQSGDEQYIPDGMSLQTPQFSIVEMPK